MQRSIEVSLLRLAMVALFLLMSARVLVAAPTNLGQDEDYVTNQDPSNTLSAWIGSKRSQTDVRDIRGIDYWGSGSKEVLMINGTAEDTVFTTFYPEEGKSAADYDFVFLSNNSEIVDASNDITFLETEAGSHVNLTSTIDFNKFPGKVGITVEVRRVSDGSLFDSLSIDYTAAGLAIYTTDDRSLISGDGRSFKIADYTDIYRKQHWDFGVFVQYLNGTDSTEILESASSSYFTLSSIKASFASNNGQVLWDEKTCGIADGDWDGTEVSLRAGCGLGFAVGYMNESYYDGFHFAFEFEQNRAGRFTTLFTWDDFTVGTGFEDEEYTNYILTEIAGSPPVVVRRVEPTGSFDKNGGEELHVEMINTADVDLISFDVNDVPFELVQGSKKSIAGPRDFYETAKFRTVPGTGRQLPWTMTAMRKTADSQGSFYDEDVEVIDETGFLFSYNDDEIQLTSLSPSIASESGGDEATLSGSFDAFDIEDAGHNILVGNIPVHKSLYVEASDEVIRFTVPPKSEIGLDWTYDVVVQIGNSHSRPLSLSYEQSELKPQTQVFGATKDPDSDVFTISYCGNTTFVTTLQDYSDFDQFYTWKLLNSAGYDLLTLENATGIITTSSTLVLQNDYFPHLDTIYKVVTNVVTGNLSTSALFLVQRTERVIVGVTILDLENRTISVPPVNTRIIAKVEVPECYGNATDLTYQWEYENKIETLLEGERQGLSFVDVHDTSVKPQFDTVIYPHENHTATGDESIATTRLGRELYVRREHLTYGTHRVQLTVTAPNDTKLYGTAQTTLSICDSPLKAVIGSGQLSRRASDAEDLYISGQGSFDPDIVSGANPSSGLLFEWTCEFSLFFNLTEKKICSDELLPLHAVSSSIFAVRKDALQKFVNMSIEGDDGSAYLRYNLTVRKEERVGHSSQKITLLQGHGLKLTTYEKIEIINSNNEPIDSDNVEFWEDVIIRPITSAATEWRFRLEYPSKEKAHFFAGNAKLISRPGYYTSTGSSAPGYQRLPLGIQADKLTPHQKYMFSISLQEPGKLTEEVELLLKTVEVPRLIFPRLQMSNGTVNTTFRAHATTSFVSHSCYSFQFYLIEIGRTSKEYCVDGCTGARVVRFQIAKPGQYTLQCRLIAANGKRVLVAKNNTAIIDISVSTAINQVQQFDEHMERDFSLGDDGSVNQKGFFVTESMYEEDGQVVAMSDNSADEICQGYTQKWARMSRSIIENELPNTANARNYVILASNFARLKCVEEAETLYELLGIVDKSIARTPPEETLTSTAYSSIGEELNVELEAELLQFYNFSMTRTLSHIAGGSTRGRIVPQDGEVNNLVLDLSEMWTKHVTTAATSGRVCGWSATYTSNSRDGGQTEGSLPSSSIDLIGVNTIQVAVMCNREQGTSLSTPFASFRWCDSIYDSSGQERKLVTMAEFFDFPYLSGVQGQNKSDSRRLVMVDITTLGKSNQLVSAMSDSMVLAQAESTEEETDACYSIGLTMGAEAMTRSDECSQNVPYHMWPRKSYGRQLSQAFENGAYQRRTIGVKVTPETRNDSARVLAQSNILGLYGAYRTTCSNGLFGHGGTLVGSGVALGGILIGILLSVLLLTALTYAFVSTLVAGAAQDEAAAAIENYVERDFFGRGQIRLNLGYDDDDASETESEASGEENTKMESTGNMDALDEVLESHDTTMPDQASMLTRSEADAPQRPPG